jgi:hypothetical protein
VKRFSHAPTCASDCPITSYITGNRWSRPEKPLGTFTRLGGLLGLPPKRSFPHARTAQNGSASACTLDQSAS